jgi:hypothetical protein
LRIAQAGDLVLVHLGQEVLEELVRERLRRDVGRADGEVGLIEQVGLADEILEARRDDAAQQRVGRQVAARLDAHRSRVVHAVGDQRDEHVERRELAQAGVGAILPAQALRADVRDARIDRLIEEHDQRDLLGDQAERIERQRAVGQQRARLEHDVALGRLLEVDARGRIAADLEVGEVRVGVVARIGLAAHERPRSAEDRVVEDDRRGGRVRGDEDDALAQAQVITARREHGVARILVRALDRDLVLDPARQETRVGVVGLLGADRLEDDRLLVDVAVALQQVAERARRGRAVDLPDRDRVEVDGVEIDRLVEADLDRPVDAPDVVVLQADVLDREVRTAAAAAAAAAARSRVGSHEGEKAAQGREALAASHLGSLRGSCLGSRAPQAESGDLWDRKMRGGHLV